MVALEKLTGSGGSDVVALDALASARGSALTAVDERAESNGRYVILLYQVGSPAVGNLVQTRNKVPINPFPEG